MGIQVHFRDFFGTYMCEFELCSKLTINEVVTGLVILNTDWFQKSYWREPPRSQKVASMELKIGQQVA